MEHSDNTIGGSPWVNLINTKRFVEGNIVDILDNMDLFRAWLKESKLDKAVSAYEQSVNTLKSLRGDFEALLDEVSEGISLSESKSMGNIKRILGSIPVILETSFDKNEITVLHHACDDSHDLTLKIIESFLDTCHLYGLGKVRQCSHEECIMYFLDTSKSGKRKWCSMVTCGNRKKASKYYNKNKKSQQV